MEPRISNLLIAHNQWAQEGVELVDDAIRKFRPLEVFLSEVDLTEEEREVVERTRAYLDESKRDYSDAHVDFDPCDNFDSRMLEKLRIHQKVNPLIGGNSVLPHLLEPFQLIPRITEIADGYALTGLYNFADKLPYDFSQLTPS